MPKSGRERRINRRLLKHREREETRTFIVAGAHWVPDTPQEERRNLRLLGEAKRWSTDASLAELLDGDMRHKSCREIAILVTRLAMTSKDKRLRMQAVRNFVQMEQQNQADERKPQENNHLHLHANPLRFLSRERLLEVMAEACEAQNRAQRSDG